MSKRSYLLLFSIVVVILSCCNLSFELFLIRLLVSMSSRVMFFTSITLGTYFLFSGFGAFLKTGSNEHKIFRKLIILEGLNCSFGVFTYFIIIAFYMFLKSKVSDINIQNSIFICFSQLISAFFGYFSGREFALILELNRVKSIIPSLSHIMILNYFGALLGSLFFTFLLLPQFEISGASFVIGIIHIIAIAVVIYLRDLRISPINCLIFTGSIFFIFFLIVNRSIVEGNYLLSRYESFNKSGRVEVARYQTHYQNIDFVFHSDGRSQIYLDGQIQLDPRWNNRYHEELVHIPIQFHNKIPKDVLILGGGDGGVAYELLKYGESINSIRLIEIDPDIIELSKTKYPIYEINQGSLENKKVQIEIKDAFVFLRNTKMKFDAIYLDFPLPQDFDLLKLYSAEFFGFVKKRLNPDGYLAFDPAGKFGGKSKYMNESNDKWDQIMMSTLSSAGFEELVPFKGVDGFIMAKPSRLVTLDKKWKDLRIHLKTLNEKRFIQSWVEIKKIESNSNTVNSIYYPKIYSTMEGQI